eukprot:4213701-Prymnesium_polylepis.1
MPLNIVQIRQGPTRCGLTAHAAARLSHRPRHPSLGLTCTRKAPSAAAGRHRGGRRTHHPKPLGHVLVDDLADHLVRA